MLGPNVDAMVQPWGPRVKDVGPRGRVLGFGEGMGDYLVLALLE